ncbi:hypothetical protein OAA05_00630 [bacterium]|nr:hypothetical protein [bacterium]
MKNDIYNSEGITDQVDVQAICKKHNVGRYDIIELTAYAARILDLRPHDALKKLLEIEDLKEFKTHLDEKRISSELKRELRKS